MRNRMDGKGESGKILPVSVVASNLFYAPVFSAVQLEERRVPLSLQPDERSEQSKCIATRSQNWYGSMFRVERIEGGNFALRTYAQIDLAQFVESGGYLDADSGRARSAPRTPRTVCD